MRTSPMIARRRRRSRQQTRLRLPLRARANAPRLVNEPAAIALPPANGEAAAVVSSAREVQTALPQLARLIGKLPAPHYPEQLIDVQGDVRVRFDVDASGRPVMSSLAVMSSSNEFFTASVFKVIPGLRFVPAVSGGTLPLGLLGFA